MIRTDGPSWTQENKEAESRKKCPPPETLHLLSAVVVWLVTGTTISSLNKWIFAVYNFRYPLLLSALHMLTAIVVDYGLIKYYFVRSKWIQGQDLTSSAKCKVFLLSLTFCASIAFGNLGLNYVQLSFAQMIYTTTPIFTLAISSLVLGKQHHVLKYTAMMPICIGASFSIMGEVQFDQTGCLFVVAATMLRGVKSIQQSILLQEEKINSVLLLYMMAIPSFCILAVAALVLENWAGFQSPLHYDGHLWGFIILSCLGSVLYNLASCSVISRTSAVTLHILGNLNVVGNLLLSQMLFGSQFSALSCAGAALTLFGMVVYQNSELIAAYLDGHWARGSRKAKNEEIDPDSLLTLDSNSEQEPYLELSSEIYTEELSSELYDDQEPWSDLELSYHSTETSAEPSEELYKDLTQLPKQLLEINNHLESLSELCSESQELSNYSLKTPLEPPGELHKDLKSASTEHVKKLQKSYLKPSQVPSEEHNLDLKLNPELTYNSESSLEFCDDLDSSFELCNSIKSQSEPQVELQKDLESTSKQPPALDEDLQQSSELHDHLESHQELSEELNSDITPYPELDYDLESSSKMCNNLELSPENCSRTFNHP